MKPFLTEVQFVNGQQICSKIIASLHQANVDVGSSLAGLMSAAILAADTMEVPLESVFACMREFRKAFQKAQEKAQAEAQTEAASKLVLTGFDRDEPSEPAAPMGADSEPSVP